MTTADERRERFRALHVPGEPLLLPNPWDAGIAKVLVAMGFAALATTSGGHAGTIGLPDGAVTRGLALAHAASLAASVDVPVSADLEDGFGAGPDDVAATVREAVHVGLAGCSVEDWSGTELYAPDLAAERIAAAAEAAHAGDGPGLVLTARAENHLRGHADLADTIARLQAFQEAGADVLYAPGLVDRDDIARVLAEVDRPLNVLALPGVPPVPELAGLGVARVSVGGSFHAVALEALARAGHELLDDGTYGFLDAARAGRRLAAEAFAPRG